MIMVFSELFRTGGLVPTIVRQGNKLYEMRVKKGKLITETVFRDTLVLFLFQYISVFYLYF
jgi:hypothetical protein